MIQHKPRNRFNYRILCTRHECADATHGHGHLHSQHVFRQNGPRPEAVARQPVTMFSGTSISNVNVGSFAQMGDPPKAGWFIVENPIKKLGVPAFQETSMYVCAGFNLQKSDSTRSNSTRLDETDQHGHFTHKNDDNWYTKQ